MFIGVQPTRYQFENSLMFANIEPINPLEVCFIYLDHLLLAIPLAPHPPQQQTRTETKTQYKEIFLLILGDLLYCV